MKITIEVSKAQYLGLRAVAVKCGIPSTEILEQFVADIAGGNGSGGSDERDMAEAYVKRCNYAGAMHYDPSDKYPPFDPDAPKNIERARKWYDAYFTADAEEVRAWRVKHNIATA